MKNYLKVLKKTSLIILVWGSVVFLAAAQEMIRNPRKPVNPNAGRILKAEKIWQVGDQPGSYYFRYPHRLRVAPDGSIFIADQEQLLKFSAGGQFLANFYKKGQGPGEIADYFSYHLQGESLFVYDSVANKVIHMNLEGQLIKEVKLEKGPYNGFYGVSGGLLVFVKMTYPPPEKRTGGLHDVICSVRLLSPDGNEEKEACAFKMKTFMAPQAMASWDPLHVLLGPDGRKLYVNHARNYLLEVFDLETGRLLFSFNRDYSPVKYVADPGRLEFMKKYNFPEIKYEIDIRGLFSDGKYIWVQTSTESEEGYDLFDVFDDRGRFIDSFYSGLKGSVLAVYDNYIFALERDEKDNLFLGKYRIVDSIR